MGNWRSVNIIGTCSPEDLPAIRDECLFGENEYEGWHCLAYTKHGSLCGINEWPAEEMDVAGNLSERDYKPQDVCDTLAELALLAPSLKLKVHCGGEYEDKTCVGTITVEGGVAKLGAPEVESVEEMDEAQGMKNMLRSIRGF